jgi:AcrR family transcriptional regulator
MARKDAVRNRARLVEAAAHSFRDRGLGVSVNAIADDAGVNVATLYRHFPTKDELIGAVFDALLEPLAVARDQALSAPGRGRLEMFVRAVVRLQAEQRGLVDALGQHPLDAEVRGRLRESAVAIVGPLVERAHEDGDLRDDVDALDLLVALRMLAVVAGAPELAPERGERYVDVVLRGLRRA